MDHTAKRKSMPHTAVIYARVSTDEQDLDLQLTPLRCFAKQRKWRVVAILTDIGSGAKNNRPNYLKLLEMAKHKEMDVVLVWRFDRFARSTKELVKA